MKPYRTVLSVPGHKPSWFDKGVASGADCLCLDLEDSVPEAEKESARAGIAEAIRRISSSHPKVGLFVRPNALDTGATGDDLAAVVVPGLTGVFAPKVGSAIDVHKYDALVDYFEHRNKVTGIEYILPMETIEGIQHCEEIGQASPSGRGADRTDRGARRYRSRRRLRVDPRGQRVPLSPQPDPAGGAGGRRASADGAIRAGLAQRARIVLLAGRRARDE
jgi:citrate lyase beta subunit